MKCSYLLSVEKEKIKRWKTYHYLGAKDDDLIGRLQCKADFFLDGYLWDIPIISCLPLHDALSLSDVDVNAVNNSMIKCFEHEVDVDWDYGFSQEEYLEVMTEVVGCVATNIKEAFGPIDVKEVGILPIPRKSPAKNTFCWNEPCGLISLISGAKNLYDAVAYSSEMIVRDCVSSDDLLFPQIKFDKEAIKPGTPVVLLATKIDEHEDKYIQRFLKELIRKTHCNVIAIFSIAAKNMDL